MTDAAVARTRPSDGHSEPRSVVDHQHEQRSNDDRARLGRLVVPFASTIAAAALVLVSLTHVKDVRSVELAGEAVEIVSASDDFVFGFVSAAWAICGSSLKGGSERSAVKTTAPYDGTVSDDVARGFSTFAQLNERAGSAAACGTAYRLLQ
jgi:hypothetical protein